MIKTLAYEVDNVVYEVEVTYKRIKRLYLTFKDDKFVFRVPYFTSEKTLFKMLDKYAKKLLKRVSYEKPWGNDYVYVFGEKEILKEGYDQKTIKEELKESLNKYCLKRLREIEAEMNISSSYKLKIKDVKSKFGSNSKATHTIVIALNMVHFSYPIIDSVIYHELAHHFHFDHSKAFYRTLLTYCPNYYTYRKMCIRRIYR